MQVPALGPTSRKIARRLLFEYEARVPRRYILLFGHMRSYSSVLCHILNSNREISGYVEMHRSYKSDKDFLELALQVRKMSGGRLQGRYLVDKLLHNEAAITPAMVMRPEVYGLFVIREPLQTFRSTIAMGLKRKQLDWKSKPDRVLRYYTRRLDGIVQTAEQKRTQSMFFEADELLENTDGVLAALGQFLELKEPLRSDYQTGELTGVRSYGDPSKYIATGTLVKERDDYSHIEIPDAIMEEAQDAFLRARERLISLCAFSVGAELSRAAQAGQAARSTSQVGSTPPIVVPQVTRPVPSSGLEEQPVFVGGSPRAGLRLLRAMLNSHPQLAVPVETRFLLEMYWDRHRFGDLSVPENRKPLVDAIALTKDYWFGRFEVDRQEAWKRMMAAAPTVGSVLGTPYVMYAENSNKPRWGDKRPMYAEHHDALFAMFPKAQLVNLIRDPRAAVASMKRLGWHHGSVAAGVEIWTRMLDGAEEARGRYGLEQYFDLRYEDLVTEPEKWLVTLCEFLGLSTESVDAMLAFHQRAEPGMTKVSPRLSSPVTAERVRAWADDLTPPEVAFVEQETARHMEHHGYDPSPGRAKAPPELVAELERLRARAAEADAAREDPAYPHDVEARLAVPQ